MWSALRRGKPRYPLGWPENKVITYSRDAKINISGCGSTSSGELQTALLNWLCKQKENCGVTTQFSLHSNLKITPQSQAKVAYTTAFRHKLIHNCITHSKSSRSIMAANAGNVPQLRVIITSHTKCTFTVMYCTLHTGATTLDLRLIWWLLVF